MSVCRCFFADFPFSALWVLGRAAASLLIVLRMYVLCNLDMRPSIAHVYCQHRHMEWEEVGHSDRGWRMGGRLEVSPFHPVSCIQLRIPQNMRWY
jgi:hypothetical protein